jgi:cytochrome c biogenesis protein ResB
MNIKVALKKTYIFLRSAKVTIFSIAAVTLLYLSGLLITQKILFKDPQEYQAWGAKNPLLFKLLEFIQFTDIYSSPLTLFFLGLFFLNLLLVFIYRIPLTIDKCRVDPDSGGGVLPYAPSMLNSKDIPSPLRGEGQGGGDTLPFIPSPQGRGINERLLLGTGIPSEEAENKIKAAFKKTGFRAVTGEQGVFRAVKNRFSPLGFLFFHASFFFCLLGGLMLFYTRFSGLAVLAEDQTFYNQAEQYYKIERFPKMARRATSLSFHLLKIIPESQGFVSTGLKVQLTLLGPGKPYNKVVEINKPLKVGDDTVVVKNIGVAPLFLVRDFNGREIERGYVYLNVIKGQEDTFSLSDKRYVMHTRFYPDFIMQDGREATKGYELNNPVFSLVVDKEGQRVWEGRLGPGETADFFPFTLSFSDIKYWVEFQVVNERGDYVIFFGFLLGAVGLILRFVFYRREIWGQLKTEEGQLVLYLDGQSTFFPGQFGEELKKVGEKIKEAFA